MQQPVRRPSFILHDAPSRNSSVAAAARPGVLAPWSLLVACLVMGSVACTPSREPPRLPTRVAESACAPAVLGWGEECSRESVAGAECFAEAAQHCTPTEFAEQRMTDEGGWITYTYRVVPLDDGCGFELEVDNRGDRYRENRGSSRTCSSASLETSPSGCGSVSLDRCVPS